MHIRLVLTLLVVLAVVGWSRPASAQTPIPDVEVSQRYTLAVSFDPVTATIGGKMQVEWTNTTGQPQESLPFRLYPNASYYGDGGIELGQVSVGGSPADVVVSADDATVMHVPFRSGVAPGDTRELEIDFTTTIPIDSAGSFGMFRGNSVDGSWSLVDWYPIVAGWEPGNGWYLDPPSGNGDPTFVTASSWSVSVERPASYRLVGTGLESVAPDTPGVTDFDLPVGREFAMVAQPADGVATDSRDAGGTDVEITLPKRDAIPGLSDLLESFAETALPGYASWFGGPATPELDVTSVPLDGALGISWSGSVWLDLEPITRDGKLDDAEREGLRFVVYHELAHQWLANLIGANTNDHAFLTEGLANTMAVALIRDTAGPEAASRAIAGWVAGPYRAYVNGGSDAVADTPARDLEPVVYGLVVYGKAGVGFEAIRQRIGDEAFRDALRLLAARWAWGIVAPDDVLAMFETSSGEQLDNLWGFWFEQRGATTAQVDAVVDGAGS